MLDPITVASRWSNLETYIEKVTEPKLSLSLRSYFQKKAEDEWGYCPDTTKVETDRPMLTQEEEAFLERVETGIMFGQYIEPEDKVKPLLSQIYEFIVYENGFFTDLPKYLQTEEIKEAFDKVENKLKEELYAQVDALLATKE